MKDPLSLLINGEEAEVEEVGALEESEIEEECSFIDIDDILDPEGALARISLRLEAAQRPPVATRSAMVVKVSH